MSLDPDSLEAEARASAGLDDFGDGSHREGLERLTGSMNTEGDLTDTGETMLRMRLAGALASRLRVEDTYRAHPEIDDEQIDGPVFVIGLPRTGTTALSQLVAADPQIRSLRLWESSDPCPPPESATEHTDPRIAQTEAGLAMMNEMFPLMASMHHEEATGPTECQDLLGMSFRTVHFDGFARVPSYLAWVTECDMDATYRYHRRVLRLLQWHCPPRLWHLKTPVHMFALDSLLAAYPDARFLWSHRDPAKVLGSVCNLIHYTRSWASDRDDSHELGAEQLGRWSEAITRAMDFRSRVGDDRFADLAWTDLQVDPVGSLALAYEHIGLEFPDRSRQAVNRWAGSHQPGAHGQHSYDLAQFGLEPEQVQRRFARYMDTYDSAT
ncbi:MAG TPA: sulfotransferase [Acidimicrobiales bacterium]|nr:sulfotransferase [Acidimicrobiales bacterium]